MHACILLSCVRMYMRACDYFILFPLPQKECGFEYTSKLQCMFQDISVSKDLNDSFKSHIAATTPLQGEQQIV